MPRPGPIRVALGVLVFLGPAQQPLRAFQAPVERRVTIANEGWQLIGDLTLPRQTGAPTPAVLLLNGAGTDRNAYRRLSRELAERGIGSLRLDLRATGESINRGRFIPFDTTGHNDSLDFDRGDADVRAALRFLAREPGVDPTRIGALGASFSGEALAKAIRGHRSPKAVAALSPGSFSDRSLADVDRDGRRWLFVYSAREMIVQRFDMARRTRQGTTTARIVVVPDSAHAAGLLAASPMLTERLAEWFSRALGVDPADRTWRRAADRVAAVLEPGFDDLRRPGEDTPNLAEGTAGRLRFYLAWYQARRDSVALRAVRRTARRLMTNTPDQGGDAGLYRGMSGPAITLLDAADLVGSARYRRHAVELFDRVRRAARVEGDGVAWSPASDVLFGDAGTAAALFAAGRRLADTGLQATAISSGRTLLRRSRPDSGGANWYRSERPPLYVLPNFSHGAAGIGTVLSIIGCGPDGPTEFQAAAASASRYLLAIARRDSAGLRIPYGWPVPDGGWARPFDVSWAHGQAGSARLFWELWRSTRDSSYFGLVLESVRGLDAANLLGSPGPGYGSERFGIDYRFGLAGVADFFADLYDETGDRQYLDRSVRLARAILSRADPSSTRAGWTAPRPGYLPHPGELALFTGLLHGAAGPGLLFLKLDALLSGRRPPGSLPDSPFGEW